MSQRFGPMRQLGYVVADIEAAMAYWTAAHGVGPFFAFPVAPIHDLHFRGQATAARVAIALAQSGPIQIELIQPLDDHPSIYREFMQTHGQGLQHVAYWTEQLDALVKVAQSAGLKCVLSGFTGDANGRFCYFEGAGLHPGSCAELSELSAAKRALFDEVARAALDWRGDKPVRLLHALK